MMISKLIYNTIFGELYRVCKTHYKVLDIYNDDGITSIKRHTIHYVQEKFKDYD